MKDLFKKSKEKSTNEKTKPTKKSGGLFGGGLGKKSAPITDDHYDEVVESADNLDDETPKKSSLKKGKSAKPALGLKKSTKAKSGKAGLDLDINKIDTKKALTVLVGILVVLILLLLASIFMGGKDEVPPPAPMPIPEQTAEPPAPETPAEPEPTTEPVATEPVAPPPAPVAEPAPASVATEPPAQVPPPAPATVDVPVAPPQVAEPVAPPADIHSELRIETTPPPQPAAPKPAPSGGKISYDEFLKETENRVFRERNTAPPTATN